MTDLERDLYAAFWFDSGLSWTSWIHQIGDTPPQEPIRASLGTSFGKHLFGGVRIDVISLRHIPPIKSGCMFCQAVMVFFFSFFKLQTTCSPPPHFFCVPGFAPFNSRSSLFILESRLNYFAHITNNSIFQEFMITSHRLVVVRSLSHSGWEGERRGSCKREGWRGVDCY